MKDNLINENIFNRCIFGKATKEEMEYSINYFTEDEQYEKCMIIKELINQNYYTEDPTYNDLVKITKLIDNHKDDLNELINIEDDLIKKIKNDNNLKHGEIKTINDILSDIDNISDDIIYNILESNKLRKEYLNSIYDEIHDILLPDIENPKIKKHLQSYRESSLKNLKKIIDLIPSE